jgi:type IX secretion system PorP/SprF family membrane protein
MKKFQNIGIALLLFISSGVFAQQESILAFYGNHLNLVNPAAVSVDGETQFRTSVRQQWTGVKDAPQTQAASFMTPLNKNLSFGVSIIKDEVFIEKQTFVAVDFSYKVQLNDALSLFMGIKAGGNNYEVNTNGLETYNYNVSDPSLQPISRFNPNIGIGFYLKHKDYFVSLSTPKMLDTKRAKEEDGFATAATDQAHYYFAAGRTFEITPSFDLVPSVMVRYVNGAPFSTDFTTTAKFDDRFDFGVTYRTDRTFAGLTKINISKKFALGYAYEYSLRSQLVGRANGSNEFFLSYKFN